MLAMVPSAAGSAIEGLLQRAEIQRAERGPHHQDSEQETEVAEAVGDEGFFRRIRRAGFFKPEPDEQVAGHADEFPEDEKLDEIVRQHDAEHREREQAQAGEEAREPAVFAHVAEGINVDRAADTGDDEHHHQAQGIELQPEIHVQIADGQPVGRQFGRRWGPAIVGDENNREDEAGNNRADGQERAGGAATQGEKRYHRRREQRQKQNQPG